ncbi:MAG: hypothetical protein ACLVC2_16860 [Emergencia timonensis]|uniref:hypothetical protein n=1 Tax=Emergencia timonensis TaxID=1776384 RepID=UPI0011C21CB3|nr:hypothetical protein [Emergencia timonensis]MBS6178644.1 hypothetical protein [Clostridiales bacterium]MCB6477450.1 hypothetical protein [Emergencia timonensis]
MENNLWLIITVAVTLAIMAFGVAGGIEKVNKVMMAALFGLFILLGTISSSCRAQETATNTYLH